MSLVLAEIHGMAKLTVSDAARVTGVSRMLLYRYIKAGRLSRTPDGLIDTAELLRAGLVLQTSDVTTPVTPLHDVTPSPVTHVTPVTMPVTEAVTVPVTPPISADTRTLERLVDVLQRELDAARERETLLLQMLSQMQQQNQRLLDMPRSAPAPTHPGPRAAVVDEAPRGEIRRRIVALLRDHPEGLSPVQTRQALGIDKDLGSTMKAMVRDGLLRRVATGRYTVA
jgi:AcrR family transcriptional regulator